MTDLLFCVCSGEEASVRSERAKLRVAVLEVDAFHTVIVNLRGSIDTARRIVSGDSFPGLHLDRGGDKLAGVSDGSCLLAVVFIDVHGVVLALESLEWQALTVGIDNRAEALRGPLRAHVHRVLACGQTLLLQRTGKNLEPFLGVLIEEVHIVIQILVSAAVVRVVEVVVTEQAEVDLAELSGLLQFDLELKTPKVVAHF